jgi:hypothetical protein
MYPENSLYPFTVQRRIPESLPCLRIVNSLSNMSISSRTKGSTHESCSANVGGSCSDWFKNAIVCCTTNGLVYCGDSGNYEYTDCPNNAECHTNFNNCYQMCDGGNPSWLNFDGIDCNSCDCQHDECYDSCKDECCGDLCV